MKYFLICLLFLSPKAFSCSCIINSFSEQTDLNPYDFIALVEIKKFSPENELVNNIRKAGDINIEIKDLFKGKSVATVFDSSFNTLCKLEVKDGEEWLLFGTLNEDNKIVVHSCGPSVKYREVSRMRDWEYFRGINELSIVQKRFGHPLKTNKRVLYPNGKTEIEQNFKNNKLDGVRKIYYPSGKLFVEENFKDGNRADYRRVYSESGQMVMDVTYSNNRITRKVVYLDSATTNRHLFRYYDDPKAIESIIKQNPKLYISYIITSTQNGNNYTIEYYDSETIAMSKKTHVDLNKGIAEEADYKFGSGIKNYKLDDESLKKKYESEIFLNTQPEEVFIQ